ncbi:MAG: hypothetical protein JO359_09555, partial [Candidatus Eremiobacteraeota bacterium]|nr:hypothetical protein [Candidatus Eremiobacteraeota bacterium]
ADRAREARLGNVVRVLVEERRRDTFVGRSMGEAPGVDGAIYFKSERRLEPGAFVEVRLVRSGAFDFYGELVAAPELAAVG